MTNEPLRGIDGLPGPLLRHAEQVCRQFETSWRTGGRPAIEDYLAGLAEPKRTALLHELIEIEAEYRRRAGDNPQLGEYSGRFPELDPAWLADALATLPAGAPPGPAGPGPGSCLGDYELLREVGRGGMGVVYRAQDRALDREVAVKILQGQYAPDSPPARRFLDEARVTGQLQHPAIPAVYQVGSLPDGRPYLAMKLIQGQTLDELLKANAAVDTLAVFEAVCQAVGFAHAHGVIHRDLKPGNVMVGRFGEVQVMDWGLAKVVSGREPAERTPTDPDPEATTDVSTETNLQLDTKTPRTQQGAVLGTPAFMAPEQAAGELDKIDARSDVFGLGALLCALLTGRPPFEGPDAERVRLRAVRGQTEAALARLDACPADPAVVTLCKRCLAIDPAERPASGDAVAEAVAGLRRAAVERAQQAERDRLAAEVRAAEQVKRRRAVQWAAAVVAAVLLLGVASTSIGLVRADAARKNAETAQGIADQKRGEAETAQQAEVAQRKKAQAKEAETTAVLTFFLRHVFAAVRPRGQHSGLGGGITLQEALLASLPALDKEFVDQPLVEARLRTTLGNTFGYLGKHREAAVQHERARAICAEQLGPDDPLTLESASNLAADYQALGRRPEALKLREETLVACRRALGPDDSLTLTCMHNLATNYGVLGRTADALKLLEETVAARRRVLGPDHEETLGSLHNLANCYFAVGRRTEALNVREETLAGCRRALAPDHPRTLAAMNTLANSYFAAGRAADACKLQQETLAARRRVLNPDHPDTLITMNNLANSFEALGQSDEAHKLREDMLAASRRVHGPDHPETLRNMGTVAESLVKQERGAEAIPLIDECLRRAPGKSVDPGLIPGLIELRLRHFQETGDASGCRASAEMWENLNRRDPASLYRAGCYRAVTAAVQSMASGSDSGHLAQEEADRALVWLTRALAAGYKDRDRLDTDKDLQAVRRREDFQKLLTSLPAAPAR